MHHIKKAHKVRVRRRGRRTPAMPAGSVPGTLGALADPSDDMVSPGPPGMSPDAGADPAVDPAAEADAEIPMAAAAPPPTLGAVARRKGARR